MTRYSQPVNGSADSRTQGGGDQAKVDTAPIVVGVDGSERSLDALALADLLARRLGGALLVVHSHPYGRLESLLGEGEYEQLVRDVSESTFHQIRAAISEGQPREMRLVSAGSPAEGIQRVAAKEGAQLIVVGSSSRAGLGRIRPGSVGERLLTGAPTAVAVAPSGYAGGDPELTVVACGFDGSPESRLALEWSARLTREGTGRLRVISVYTPTAFGNVGAGGAFSFESVNRVLRRELAEAQERALSGVGTEAEGVLLDGAAAQVLADASSDADVLIVGSRGYGPVRAVVLGSVSTRLMRDAVCPVIVCPRGADI